ncbi:TldD/PmbA family protein [Aeromonas sp. 3925]|uniref:TldD/PmbA family protein n=1 Tax=Aeromonas genomosp. paramedia TaxID=3086176 RepID=UPI001FFDCF92|nr:metallopeptidase TldD-related protein [Aeromonas genomosp. paramedia]MCK2082957.1 TldD/PmbA family protein [Aeromonas genomosp. paramedia]
MSQLDMNQLLARLLDKVADLDAEADVIANQEKAFSLKADKGELGEYKVTSSQQIGIRLIKEGRVGIAYSESLDEPALDAMVQDALDASRFAKVDPDQRITVQQSRLTTDCAEIHQADTTAVEEKIALALRLESDMLALPDVTGAPYNGFFEGESRLWLANSQGTFCEHQEFSVGCHSSALIEREGRQSMHYQGQYARRFDELESQPLIRQIHAVADGLLMGEAVPSGRYSVLFSTNCFASLFGCFQGALSGKWAQQGINPWRGKLGQNVASRWLTLESRAYMPGGMNIKAFDGEGAATSDLLLIGEGELKTLLHNSATARHFGVASNGSAARSARSALDVTARHLVFGTGPHSEGEVQSGDYLELLKLDGLHSGADAVSGDFSFGASGFLCRDGVRVQPVRGITVAGNFYRLLGELEAVGNRLHHNDGKGFYAPLIRFGGLNVAGK